MDVKIFDNELKELKALYDDNHEEDKTNMELIALTDNNHWKLRAPQHYIMTAKLFTEFPNDPFLHTLTADISNVVQQYFLQVKSFQQDTGLFLINVSTSIIHLLKTGRLSEILHIAIHPSMATLDMTVSLSTQTQ
ncbi:hypothetical protein BU17DRAFT_63396 [Hysterangium stoloniferum]|nr:hypothetical protein BU17DRAFT_63396 [Hysterangium stoloniferum]